MAKSVIKKLRRAAVKFKRDYKVLAVSYRIQCEVIADLIREYGTEYRENEQALEKAARAIERIRVKSLA